VRYNHESLLTETKTRRIEPDVTVVEIIGRLNLGNLLLSIEGTIRRVIDEGSRKLVIDLGGLNSLDSSGIGMLVSCAGHMRQSGGQMRIAGAQGTVAKVFAMVHMHMIVPLDPDVAAASAGFTAAAAS
jgi:anti-sigma B factor antagonist